ncbi:enoyl-CoA hydratase/carnithine racemase [Tamaricihabitans halophyticus]|uniref:Enoyl-CoA hydratase/carnithine racemase n=1 Tax=Tamaricihabitans halophyticus TaxID=1262583 RepID=A0A4V2STB4_9PSEU|nr:crotonase/enoyl-CoA hydratase family protein [Tamaricihabitans halophyticus]TCP50076.1 enoyl-CoA hydratase/carnithine racemase [Tamaricihabitans halophyticus]
MTEQGPETATDRVTCEITEGVADVRLNRPEKINALDQAMFEALVHTGLRLAAEPTVRAVVLSGIGRGFCAGLDFDSFRAMADGSRTAPSGATPAAVGPARALGQQAAHVWAQLPVPVIAAVHGHALGGGLQIALGADIRIVAPDAKLSVMELHWGLVPDMTGTQLLPELVGRDVAKELTFTARVFDGHEAVQIGLATRLAEDAFGAAHQLAGEIAGKNPHAIRGAKRLLDMAGCAGLEEGFAAEQREIGALIGSPNQIEAVRANLAKETPTFVDPPAD